VSFDRVIPPGEEGKIKVKVVTKGYGGNKYNKSIRVDTNDPNHAKIELKISGDVKTFATVIPKSVYLNGKVGDSLSQVVKIVPETPELFKIMKVSAITDTDIQYSLQEIDKSGKKFYELTIENTKKTPGRYFDTISIITDKSDQMPLTIYVRGNIKSDAEIQPADSEKIEPPVPPEATAPGTEVKPE
jgi:hypothetical protein